MPAEKKYFERVAVIAHPQLDEAAQEAAQVAAYLNSHGIFSSQGYLQDEILYTGIKNKEYDLIIALGGDGTMLRRVILEDRQRFRSWA